MTELYFKLTSLEKFIKCLFTSTYRWNFLPPFAELYSAQINLCLSSLRYALCDPDPEYQPRGTSAQRDKESDSMQKNGAYKVYQSYSTGLPSFQEDSCETDCELGATGSGLAPPKNDVHAAYEHPQNISDIISWHNPYDSHMADSPVVLSPSARRNFESSMMTSFESATGHRGYFEQDTNRARSPSILINTGNSWHSANTPCRDIRRRPSPYALLPALQFPDELQPRSPDTEESTSVTPVDNHTRQAIPDHDANEPTAAVKKKKAKMHACKLCGKNFPRPSGLKTHMNAHNNHKPFSCAYPGCERTFTVRSNAKRHLRTHGIHPDDAVAASMDHDHELNSVVPQLKWMPPMTQTGKMPVVPSERGIPMQEPYVEEQVEERNSYEEAGIYPYHASQYRRLPGPVVETPRSIDP
ncbi:c2h2 conidiation transcription factor [Lentinula edodes]|uniref:C2h2 conidiation transcription factor n=1 Tax=Lentinula edodes TaxID=5353 RepID=A0A1Q3ENY4_LENED|nr:c2h2 conidiation transcription factor [Lentinula edodes]